MPLPLRNLLFCLLSVSLLGGCWDAREIEERSSVIAIAFDKHPKGYEISVQVPIPLKIVGSGGGGGSESGQNAVKIFSGTGETLSDTMDDILDQTNQQLFLGHARVILIGEALAREGMGSLVDAIRRNPEVRRRQWPLVVKGKAKEALQTNPKLEQIPAQYIITMMETGQRTGRFSDEDLGKTYINLSNPAKNPLMNYMEISEGNLVWKGLALFEKDRMVGKLSREESQSMLRLREQELGETANIPCGHKEGKLVFQPKELERKIQVKPRKGALPEIEIFVKMQGEIIEKICDLDLRKQGIYEKINRWVADRYEQTDRKTIRAVQKKWKVDAFNFGNQIRAYHPNLWKKMDWNRDFPHVPIRVRYDVQVLRSGLEAK